MLGWLLIGIILALALYLLLKWWANTEVKSARKGMLWAIGIVCLLLALLLIRVGRPFMAALPVLFAVWRITSAAATVRGWANKFGASKFRGHTTGAPRQGQISLSEAEALEVLGLETGASKQDINSAYRRLMAQCHPDKGGSDWMAAKLTEAKRVLLDGR